MPQASVWLCYLTFYLEWWLWPWHVTHWIMQLYEIHMHAKYQSIISYCLKVTPNVKVGNKPTNKQINRAKTICPPPHITDLWGIKIMYLVRHWEDINDRLTFWSKWYTSFLVYIWTMFSENSPLYCIKILAYEQPPDLHLCLNLCNSFQNLHYSFFVLLFPYSLGRISFLNFYIFNPLQSGRKMAALNFHL